MSKKTAGIASQLQGLMAMGIIMEESSHMTSGAIARFHVMNWQNLIFVPIHGIICTV